MIIQPLVPAYSALLARYLYATQPLQREAAMSAATELAKTLLSNQVSMDEMLALHQRAQARLAAAWRDAPLGSAQADGYHALAAGGAMPLMLAVLLPQQLDEQARAQRLWQQEHAKLAAMFEQTDDLVLVFDPAGQLEYLNPAFERATGWCLAAALARQGVVWPGQLPAQNTLHVTAPQACADDTQFLATWSVSPISDEDGQRLSHVCIGRDITQMQRLEEGVRQNDRLRAVATLAAGVAHDFNNLLGSITGLAELCALQADTATAPGARQARNLAGILQASHRAAELVGELLSFARENPPSVQAVALLALLQRCEPLLTASLPRGVQLQIEPLCDAVVLADAAQIEQVLLNLVKNAGYAMRLGGGVVRLLADLAPSDVQPAAARLRVIDRGEGIAPEALPRIFDPFFTTKPVGEGTGLGLAAAHGIVRHHGGRLEASCSPEVGTVFTLLLPLAEAGNSG